MKGLRIIKIGLIIVLAQMFISGCYYDVEEDLYPTIECSVENMSLMNDIMPILKTDCFDCHSQEANFGNVTLEGYSELIKYVDDGSMLGVIKHNAGFSPMPKGAAKLLDCEIEKIESWINDGAINN